MLSVVTLKKKTTHAHETANIQDFEMCKIPCPIHVRTYTTGIHLNSVRLNLLTERATFNFHPFSFTMLLWPQEHTCTSQKQEDLAHFL